MRTWKSWTDDEGAGEIGISAGGGGLRVRSLPAGALEHADMTTDSAIIPALLRRIWALTKEVSDYEDRNPEYRSPFLEKLLAARSRSEP